VYEGYKTDCPDFQGVPLGERWVMPFDELVRHIAENARNNLTLMRTDSSCLTVCRIAMGLPTLLTVLCPAAPMAREVPSLFTQVFALLCAIVQSVPGRLGTASSALWGVTWCKESFCTPPAEGTKE
jgi:hypothetical protein